MVAAVEVRRRPHPAAAEGGYAQATDVADYLVGKGLPFREAHRTAGRLVVLAAARGAALSELTAAELAQVGPLFDEEYYDVVRLDRVIAGKVSPGGTAPVRVAEQLDWARVTVETVRSAVHRLRAAVSSEASSPPEP